MHVKYKRQETNTPIKSIRKTASILKQCTCNGRAYFYKETRQGQKLYQVKCTTCTRKTRQVSTRAEAISLWNEGP